MRPRSEEDAISDILRDMSRLEDRDDALLKSTQELIHSGRSLDEAATRLGIDQDDERSEFFSDYLEKRKNDLRAKLADLRVGSYQILEEVASGGMGIVFRARQESPMFTRDVAIKFMLARPEADARDRELFLAEVKALANLNHPNLVSIYDSGIEGDLYHFSMELVEGVSLADWCDSQAPTIERRVEVVRDIARALAYLHENGVVHRDVKPGNILVDGNGPPKLLDFGIAQFATDSERRVLQVGTPHYMAPEVIDPAGGFGSIGAGTDLYGLGAVLFRLLAGRDVFGEDDVQVVLDRTLHEAPAFPRSLGIPYALERIISRCLRKQTDERYSDAKTLAEDLEGWLRSRRQRTVRAVLVTIAFVGLSILWLAMRERPQSPLPESDDREPRLELLAHRVTEISKITPRANDLSEKDLEARIQSLNELLLSARQGDDAAEEELKGDLAEFWKDRVEIAREEALAVRQSATEAVARSIDSEGATRVLQSGRVLEEARVFDRQSYEEICATIETLRGLQETYESRWRAAEQSKETERRREEAKRLRIAAEGKRAELSSDQELSESPETRDIRDRANQTMDRAELGMTEGRYREAGSLFELAEGLFSRIRRLESEAFDIALKEVHEDFIRQQRQLERNSDQLDAQVLEDRGAELASTLRDVENSWRNKRLNEARVSVERFSKLWTEATTESRESVAEATKARALLGEFEDWSKLPAVLESDLTQARTRRESGMTLAMNGRHRAAANTFKQAYTLFKKIQADAKSITRGMRWIPPGRSNGNQLTGFWIDECEVSANAIRSHNPSRQSNSDVPATGVTLEAAKKYAKLRSAELPTAAMWRRAASWTSEGKTRAYPFGDQFDGERINAYGGKDGYPGLAPVGSMSAGRSASGCFHMSGNAAEWALDDDDPTIAHVLGGSFKTADPSFLRSNEGLSIDVNAPLPESLLSQIGFRCVVRAVKGENR